jgi:spore coat polysaccharide biosynthesis predicted glycosyltransferase SpsG
MQVHILTEGGRGIGIGHLTRCISFYEALEEKKIEPKLIINGDDSIYSLLGEKNFQIFNWLKEKDKLFKITSNAGSVIVDSYLGDISFYEYFSKIIKVPVYIDDGKRLDYPKGIVINGSIYAQELGYFQKEGVTYLLGEKYIPLRKEFWKVDDKKINENIKNIMVTLGGTDPVSLTPKVLKTLADNYPNLIKSVIIGKGFSNDEDVNRFKDSKTNIVYDPDVKTLKQIMFESDTAISASGQTLYELAKVGVPIVAIAVADNQLNNIRGWLKKDCIEYAGWWNDTNTISNINKSLKLLEKKSVREARSKVCRALIDGKGARRVVQQILNCILQERGGS